MQLVLPALGAPGMPPPGPRGAEGTSQRPTHPTVPAGPRMLLTGEWGAPVRRPERSARAPRAAASSSLSCFGRARRGWAATEAASPGGDPRRAPAGPPRLRSASTTAARARRCPGGRGGQESQGALLGSGAETSGNCDHGVSPSPWRARPSSSRRAAPPPPDAPAPPLALSLNHARARTGPRVRDSALRSSSLVRLEPRLASSLGTESLGRPAPRSP